MPFSLTIPSVSSRGPSEHFYHAVPAPDEETTLASPGTEETRIAFSERKFLLDPSFWLTVSAVLSVAVTIWNLLFVHLASREPHVSYLAASVGIPYNGLEKLLRNESSPSWPLSSAHYPDFIGATQNSCIHHALSNGSMVHLDSEHSIVIQHRVRDYRLEHCAVRFQFSGPGQNPHDFAREYGQARESPYLSLSRLEDMRSKAVLTSSALPTPLASRKEFLGDITPDGLHSMQSPSFQCSMGSIQTLEIAVACMSDPCIMEFRLTQLPPQQGFWVVQSEEELTPT